ncbi:MAG: hypothetical protein FJZ57_00105 [Chlamydiae bacterium]|nr:hypothetical protein [Chlamydiota bacterium]
MTNFEIFLHSPFSKSNIDERNNKVLLLQFILSEIFNAESEHKNNTPLHNIFFPTISSFYPLDWSTKMGPLNKVVEHSLLLPKAFPEQKQAIKIFKHALTNTTNAISNYIDMPSENFELQLMLYLKQLYLMLEPLMIECKSDENFLFFLLKNSGKVHSITYPNYLMNFFVKNCGHNVDSLCESICDKFHNRGFACLIPEIKAFIANLKLNA